MPPTLKLALQIAGLRCRGVAALLVARLWPGMDRDRVEARLAARPVREQVALVGGVLAALFLVALLAAQFGWIGILVFWLAVILVVR